MTRLKNRTYYLESLDIKVIGDLATCTVVDWSDFIVDSATIFVPTGAGYNIITFYHTYRPDGTFYPLYREGNTAVTIAVVAADRTYKVPAELLGCAYWKCIANVAGTYHVGYRPQQF